MREITAKVVTRPISSGFLVNPGIHGHVAHVGCRKPDVLRDAIAGFF